MEVSNSSDISTANVIYTPNYAIDNLKNYASDSLNLTNRSAFGENYSFINGDNKEGIATEYLFDKIKKVYNWFWNQLDGSRQADGHPKENLLDAQNHSNEKRSYQQLLSTVSQKQYFFDSSEAQWDKINLCIFGDNGILAGATLPDINFTHPNEQRILLFNINNSAFQKLDALSTAISAQMPSRQGQNNIASACGDRYFHIITEDALQGIFHTAIANETLVIPQYMAFSYAVYNITSKGYVPRPIKLLGNGCAIAPPYDSTYYFSYTNATGRFDSPGWNMDTFTTQNPFPAETLSYTSGTSSVLENIGNNQQLYVPNFGQSFTPIGTNIIDLNNQTIDPSIINQFYGAKIPTLYGRQITLIAPANNYATAALVTAILSQRLVTSSRMLTPNSGIGIIGVMNIANCEDFPDIYAYARDALGTASNYVIMYDVVNATLNSSSILGGEQTYNNFNLTAPAQPQIGCVSNGVIMIAYLENGQPAFFTFNFLNPNTPSPSPAASPSPSPAASPSPPPIDLFIRISLPPNLGETPVPVTPDLIMIGNSTEIIKVVDLNQYELFYPNSTSVANGANLSRDELYSLTLSQGNATKGSFPVLEACDAQGACQLSTAEGYNVLFTGSKGSNVLLISLTTTSAFLITTIATIIVYRNCIDKIAPYRNRKKADLNPKENDDQRDYHQMQT